MPVIERIMAHDCGPLLSSSVTRARIRRFY